MKRYVSRYEKNGVAFRVAGRRDHQHAAAEIDRIASGRLQLDRRRARVNVIAMQHALAAEPRRETGVIGDVVLMREQHPRRAAHRRDVLHQRPRKARRVDEDVALRPANEIADRAERRLGGVAAAVDVAIDQLRQRRRAPDACRASAIDPIDAVGHEISAFCAASNSSSVCRLMKDSGLIAGIAENGRREDAAGVAIDAGGVDVEIAGNVLGKSLRQLGHAVQNGAPG